MRTCFLALCILALALRQAEGTQLYPFMTFTNTLPGNMYFSGPLTSTNAFKLVITWNTTDTNSFIYGQFLYGGEQGEFTPGEGEETTNPGSYIF